MRSVFTKEYEELLTFLINARKNKRLTQVQIAKKLKKPQSFVSKYERGERRLDVIEFLEVAEAIGIEANKLFSSIQKKMARVKKNNI
ncbi:MULTISPECIES: helix-turn-helix domain-containing protein [unclassified Nitrospina]|uniref:helix-turn-helix domain-containing protein n=1 Tax=unclassified Nitrospina TaxID=2638683 RepID=UPI003F9D7450